MTPPVFGPGYYAAEIPYILLELERIAANASELTSRLRELANGFEPSSPQWPPLVAATVAMNAAHVSTDAALRKLVDL